MANKFSLAILTPEKTVFEGEATSLVVPCQSGYLGIMAYHAPFAGLLQPGKIFFRKASTEEVNLFSQAKGFLEMSGNRATLLLYTEPDPEQPR